MSANKPISKKTRKPRSTMKGRFIPKNPGKYLGNPNAIYFRSSWELKLFQWLDGRPAVLQWASEEFSIPYLSPLDGAVHQYYPDALVVYKGKDGAVKKELIEIKPLRETELRPNATLVEAQTVQVNKAKWQAAIDFCSKNGLVFRVITEKTLFANKKSK